MPVTSSSPIDSITESPDVVALLDKVALLDLERKCEKMKVCVTGSTSMVGSHIVRRLLRVGHVVHAPVRGPLTEEKVAFLRAMPGAKERLKLFEVTSLLDEGTYDEPVAGCDVVQHVASPFFMVGSSEQLEEKLFDPALKGVENVLTSCSKSSTVKKVILTGTVLTTACDFTPSFKNPNWTVSEKNWETNTSRKDFSYVHSKILQEKRAHEISEKQSQWELVVLLIGGSFGPMCFTEATGVNAMFLKQVRMGLFFPACPPLGFPMQDVRDVALMHSLAMSSLKVKGRYIIPQRLVMFFEFCNVLKSDKRTKRIMLPLFEFPTFFFKSLFKIAAPLLGIDSFVPRKMWGGSVKFDLSKVYADFDLDKQGYEPLHIRESMVDMDLTFQKYGVSAFSPSLARYRSMKSP